MLKFAFALLLNFYSIPSFATAQPGKCQNRAIQQAEAYAENILKAEWGWPEVVHTERQIGIRSQLVSNKTDAQTQYHEDYIVILDSTYEKGRAIGNSTKFSVKMLAVQLNPEEEYSCYTRSFRMIKVDEGVSISQ